MVTNREQWPVAVPYGDGTAVALLINDHESIVLDGNHALKLAEQLIHSVRVVRGE